jgi:hypothetical protein
MFLMGGWVDDHVGLLMTAQAAELAIKVHSVFPVGGMYNGYRSFHQGGV